MIKKLVMLFVFVSFSQAYFMTQNSHSINNQILQNFDVDIEFLKDSMYSSSKEVANNYKMSYFIKVLKDGHNYIPLLLSMLRENEIPEIFLYLAMAESNFSPNATSKRKATGLWQFMPATARKFGLRVDDYLDQRRDPVKSTKAAIKYLKYLHKEFGKWYLVAMAYNCGEGRVRKAIRQANSDDLKILLDEKEKYIPKQTRIYIRKILAIASVSSNINFMVENDSEYILNQGKNNPFDIITVPSATSLANVAQSIGISSKKLKGYNPQLRYYFTPPDGKKYKIYIPYGTKNEFVKKFKPSKKFNGFYVHIVKKGDNLWDISRKYGIKHSLIKKFNNLKSSRLRLKQKLIIPTIKIKPKIYIVKKGDTLQGISSKFSIKTSKLKKENKIKKYIKPGDKLVIPSK